ncbi:Hypothetical predicted protein [Cloeon dipterum]|uniref:Uncharacterized protein n=1 Tax=Cloeon dipterum TaxID=197152 RepID=A0A8S1DDW2_9INSE|nr:Hypothetical predicted protein [Cloeon dipterum]
MILLTLLLAATVAASPTAQPSTPVATTTAPPASTATATLPPRAAVPPAAPPMASLPSSVIPSIQSHPTTVISSSSATVTTSRLPSSTSTATATQVTRAATIVSSSPAPSTIGGGAWTTEQLASLAPPAHLPTLLEERLDTLACDISLPPNAKIWRANQTEELLLPIQVSHPYEFSSLSHSREKPNCFGLNIFQNRSLSMKGYRQLMRCRFFAMFEAANAL